MDLLPELIDRHGWHVLGEVATLLVAMVVTALWIRALLRGRARPIECAQCGRLASRATALCPRCGDPLGAADRVC